jgi:hypothetical protein
MEECLIVLLWPRLGAQEVVPREDDIIRSTTRGINYIVTI